MAIRAEHRAGALPSSQVGGGEVKNLLSKGFEHSHGVLSSVHSSLCPAMLLPPANPSRKAPVGLSGLALSHEQWERLSHS